MRFIAFLLVATIAVTYAQHDHDHHIRTRFLNQPLDHFNPFERRTWDMRYIENTQFFQDGGPIYIFLTAYEEINGVYDTFIREGLIHEVANETNGLLFALEHRYFGQSRPTRDSSFENLQWLNIHQVLADIARFIAHTRQFTYGAENSRVILWGRGFAGSLAIWARQKYPNLVDGAWGSSAPLNAVLEYSQILVNAYTTLGNIGGPECSGAIRQGK
jgi:thymus-specific serine protease